MNKNYRMGMYMEGPEGQMRQVQTLAPPMAHDAEAVVENGRLLTDRSFDNLSLDIITRYIASENNSQPYTDAQILGHLIAKRVYSFDLQSIAQARKKLKIPAPEERRK